MLSTPRRLPWVLSLALLVWSAPAWPAPGRGELKQAKALHGLGMRSLAEGRHEVAARFFRRTLRLVPGAPGAHRGLGLALAAQGDCEEAARSLRTYVERLVELPGDRQPQPEALRALADCEARTRSMGGPKGGSLVIGSGPRGATAFLDGREVGSTPVKLVDLAPGPHEVRVTLPGHTPVERAPEVAEGKTTTLRLRLVRTARLDLLTSPTDAEVLLDDAPAGRTPLALPGLDAGSHRLEVRGAGLPRPWVAALELAPGQTATLNVPLVAEGGLLAVRTEPPGAMVTLDDAPVGHTPFGPNLVSEGTHWLRVAKPGFSLGQRRVEVDGQREVDLELALEPVRLDLRVLGLSGGATVYVDGEPRPVEDGWVRGLAPGPHEVAASQEGYQVWSTRVVLQPGHPARVEAELAQVATGGGPAWWAITTSVVAGGALAGATALATGAVGDGDVVPAAGLGTLGAAAAVLAVQAWLDRPATALPAEEELELPGD